MTDVKENYKWEAERRDGTVFSIGGDLSDCVRLSLIPNNGSRLPQHDFVGVPLVKRFCRGFQKVRFAGRKPMPGVIFWIDGESMLRTSEDLTAELSPGDYVGKGVAGENWYCVSWVNPDCIRLVSPYQGITKKNGLPGRRLDPATLKSSEQYVHCVEMGDRRVWVNYETGSVLVTPKDHQLYL